MTERDLNRVLALGAAAAALAGPRRTRPLAGFLYGVALSRAQGASRRRLEAKLLDLFDERQSAHAKIDAVERRRSELGAHLDLVVAIIRGMYGDLGLEAIYRGTAADAKPDERVPVFKRAER